ncbi:ROK family protein [Eubacteriaceae bacterium ES2]|nr:ROK family protein [Eubacteriaceae bacterium ES2]
MGIGIDLGGTAIKGGIVSDDGKIIETLEYPTVPESGYKNIVRKISHMISELLDISESVNEVGIGIPGIVDANSERILSCPNLGWKNKNFKFDLEKKLSVKVNLINDATAAAMGEFSYGSGVGAGSMIMLTLGTGIGGGIIINDQIISGVHGVASEIGHMIVGENFYDCECGKNGCLETFSSVTALKKYIDRQLQNGVHSSLRQYSNINGEIIFNEAQKNDHLAHEAVDRMCHYLGMAISNLNDVLDPNIFVIGGGLSASGDFLLNRITEALYKFLTYKDLVKPKLVLASLGNEAGLIGAGSLKNYH